MYEPLGEMRGARPRPTYTVPLTPEWLGKNGYPKSNSRKIAPAATVHWKLNAWRKVEGSYEGVQSRTVWAAAFDGTALACCFTAIQTRNCTEGELGIDVYAITCDDASQELSNHASTVQQALGILEDRDWLWPGEAAIELNGLYVPPDFKCKMLWKPAMLTVLERLASTNCDEALVCILEAKPLEIAWREQSVSEYSRHRKPPNDVTVGPDEPSERELHLAFRRAAALQSLYRRELDFEPLTGGWMARVVEARLPHY